jgi:flagellar basal-body rod protein FlgG
MDKGIFVALSGAVLQERRMEVLTDNLANVNTTGYKGQKPLFEASLPDQFRIRNFGRLGNVATDFTQGVLQKTERKLDFAVRGDGFFVVDTPLGKGYTRDGSFTVSTGGELLTREGYQVLGEDGPVKLSSADVSVDALGKLNSGGKTIGALKLATFNDLTVLRREGAVYRAVPGAQEQPVSPNTQVEQGYVETSNVNAVRAMTTMIEAMRSYETHSKMIQSIDDQTRKSIEEVGRAS